MAGIAEKIQKSQEIFDVISRSIVNFSYILGYKLRKMNEFFEDSVLILFYSSQNNLKKHLLRFQMKAS